MTATSSAHLRPALARFLALALIIPLLAIIVGTQTAAASGTVNVHYEHYTSVPAGEPAHLDVFIENTGSQTAYVLVQIQWRVLNTGPVVTYDELYIDAGEELVIPYEYTYEVGSLIQQFEVSVMVFAEFLNEPPPDDPLVSDYSYFIDVIPAAEIFAVYPETIPAGLVNATLALEGIFYESDIVLWNGVPIGTLEGGQEIAVPYELAAVPGVVEITVARPGGPVSEPWPLEVVAGSDLAVTNASIVLPDGEIVTTAPFVATLIADVSEVPAEGVAFQVQWHLSCSTFSSGSTGIIWLYEDVQDAEVIQGWFQFLEPTDCELLASLYERRPGGTLLALGQTPAVSFTVTGPSLRVPIINSLTPGTLEAGSGSTQLVLDGQFRGTDSVFWNGEELVATFENDQLIVDVPANLLTEAGVAYVTLTGANGLSSAGWPVFITDDTGSIGDVQVASGSSPQVSIYDDLGENTVLTVAASGEGTVAIAEYHANPTGASAETAFQTSTGAGEVTSYFDINVAPGSEFGELTVTYCDPLGATMAAWYDPENGWLPAAHQSMMENPVGYGPDCIWIVLNETDSSPLISQLTGTVFAAGIVADDTTPPTLGGMPADITATATSSAGASVTYDPPAAQDNLDPDPVVTCEDTSTGDPVASGSTFSPGTTEVTCVATDAAGNTSEAQSFTVSVTYAWAGVSPPINPNGSSTFKAGRVVPVRFKLAGASARIRNANATISISRIDGDTATVMPLKNNVFRNFAGQYIYSLKTTGYEPGLYRITISLGDGELHTVDMTLTKGSRAGFETPGHARGWLSVVILLEEILARLRMWGSGT